jgi:hypothetical protein
MAAAGRVVQHPRRRRSVSRAGAGTGVPLGMNGARYAGMPQNQRSAGRWAQLVAAWRAFHNFMRDTF